MSSEANHDTRTTNTPNRRFVLSILTVLLAITVAIFWGDTANLFLRRFFSRSAGLGSSSSITTTATNQVNTVGNKVPSKMKTPIYFLSHGGVSITPKRVESIANTTSQTSCMKWSIRPTANSRRSAARLQPRSSHGRWWFSLPIGRRAVRQSKSTRPKRLIWSMSMLNMYSSFAVN